MDLDPCKAVIPYVSPACMSVTPRWRKPVDLALATVAIMTSVVAPVLLLSSSFAIGLGIIGLVVALAAIFGSSKEQRARDALHDSRVAALLTAGIPCKRFVELERLVEGVDRATARRYELDDLLGRFVMLSGLHDRARTAVAMSDRAALERASATAAPHTARSEVCAARLAEANHCAGVEARLADELATIEDLIALVAQRSACPELPPADDVLERCTSELESDAAAQQD